MRWWKILGLAGLAGVAATGAVTVHAERRRRAYAPDEIRARLHERVAGSATTDPPVPPPVAGGPAVPADDDPPAGSAGGPAGRLRAAVGRVRRRLRGPR